MVVIRLARGGAKKRPFFNIVATDSRNARDGRFIERLGYYNPVSAENEPRFRIANDRLVYWTGVGAQLSPTVARLVKEFTDNTPAAERKIEWLVAVERAVEFLAFVLGSALVIQPAGVMHDDGLAGLGFRAFAEFGVCFDEGGHAISLCVELCRVQ